MDEKTTQDLNLISLECKLLEDVQAEFVIKNIDTLEQKYPEEYLITIYNYFLSTAKNPDILMHLIRCADKHRDKSSLSVILDLLLDRENSVNLRAMCAKAIANFKDTTVVTPLLYCLNNKDEHYKIRLACADALGRIGDKYAVAPLIQVVQDEDEKSVYVRESAAMALGMLGDFRAIDPLVSILESKKGFLDKFTFLKERVIEALGKLHSPNSKVFKALEHALSDESSSIRINAIEALMEFEDDRAYDLIKARLKDSDDEVKRNALIALYNMTGIEILHEVLGKGDYCGFVRSEAQDLIDEYECEEEE